MIVKVMPYAGGESAATMASDERQQAVLRLCRGLLLAVVLIGATCRIVQYAWRTSLWHDEALVTISVMQRGYEQLLRPLDYEQAAPPLFLWAERALFLGFGFGEYQLRLVSLICGLVSVVLFTWLAWRLFPAPVALCVAGLFALCDKLIWHSAEVKQYGSDVLAAVLLLFLAIGLRHPLSHAARAVMLSLAASLLLWFSFPAVLVFGGVILMLLPRVWRQTRLPGVVIALAACLLPAASFALLYWLTVRGHAGYLDVYWKDHLADWSRPWSVPWWVLKEVYSLCDHPYRSFGWIVLPTAAAGAVFLYRFERRNVLWACVGAIGFCLLAALVDQYPFTGERITIFLVPCLFLLFGAGLEWIRASGIFRRAWFLPALPMLVVGIAMAGAHAARPHSRSAMRPIAQYVREHRRPGEAICLVGEGTSERAHFVSGRNLELVCYWPDVPGPLYGYPPRYPRLQELAQVREKRFWIVFAALPEHGTRYMSGLLEQARSVGREVDRKQLPGGGAYLFEGR